jgi:hypothetical protein
MTCDVSDAPNDFIWCTVELRTACAVKLDELLAWSRCENGAAVVVHDFLCVSHVQVVPFHFRPARLNALL